MHPKVPINGFTLIDSEQRAKDYPKTWAHPAPETLRRIEPGYHVKVGVSQSGFSGVRFWALVKERIADDIVVQIDQPDLAGSGEHGLYDQDIIVVSERNIFGIADASDVFVWMP